VAHLARNYLSLKSLRDSVFALGNLVELWRLSQDTLSWEFGHSLGLSSNYFFRDEVVVVQIGASKL